MKVNGRYVENNLIKFRQSLFDKSHLFQRYHYWGYINNRFVPPVEAENTTNEQFTGQHTGKGVEIYDEPVGLSEELRMAKTAIEYQSNQMHEIKKIMFKYYKHIIEKEARDYDHRGPSIPEMLKIIFAVEKNK